MLERRLDFIRRLPDLKQTDRRMKPVKNCQRHRNVSYDSPSPVSKKLEMSWPKLRSVLLQGVDGPHCHVGDYEKSHQLSSGLGFSLLCISATPPPAIQHEDGLETRLDEGEDLC